MSDKSLIQALIPPDRPMHPIDHIRKFAKLTPDLEANLRKIMQERVFAKGDVVQGAKNLASYAYFLTQGAARFFYTAGGKEHTMSFSFGGEFVMLSRHVVRAHPDTVAIHFMERTNVIFVPHLKLKNLLDDSDAVSDTEGLLFLNAALLQYGLFLEERIDVMHSLSADERYRWVMKRYPRLEECATTTQVASFLGLTKETLYRIKGGRYSPVKRRKNISMDENVNDKDD